MSAAFRALVERFRKPAPVPAQPASPSPAQAIRAAEADINARLKALEAQTSMRIERVSQQYDPRDPIPWHVIGVRITMTASGSDK